MCWNILLKGGTFVDFQTSSKTRFSLFFIAASKIAGNLSIVHHMACQKMTHVGNGSYLLVLTLSAFLFSTLWRNKCNSTEVYPRMKDTNDPQWMYKTLMWRYLSFWEISTILFVIELFYLRV